MPFVHFNTKAREDHEAQAQHGLFHQLRSHMSTLKSPFNPNDTPSPVDVTLDDTPRVCELGQVERVKGDIST
jgi:hypothetical protein